MPHPAREADVPGPRVPLPARALREEDLEAPRTFPEEDEDRGRGLRPQLRLRELDREKEASEGIRGVRHAGATRAARPFRPDAPGETAPRRLPSPCAWPAPPRPHGAGPDPAAPRDPA